jgi:hypothetical protein
MARPLTDLLSSTPDVETATHDQRLTRRTGRSFAAAVSVLLLASLVVNRSSTALTGPDANSGSVVSSGTIEISDDDGGRSLFDLKDLTPVRPVVRCIDVAYTGTILPVSLHVRAEAAGTLSQYLDVTIEEGSGGDFESCAGFVASDVVYQGVLPGLVDLGWVELGAIVNSGDHRSFRVELNLQDRQEALGQVSSMDLAWEVVPS